ncbi:hypothetical protein [Streptomyces sp. NPDC059010]|uniref:hypothetical protein n=1 Tax=Streptomyces sp. NPDC059010 TaxID=3346695 RepID=UPI003688F350
MSEPGIRITARKIAVGREIPESVPEERVSLYRWLGQRLTGTEVATPTTERTVYVRPEELYSPMSESRDYLARALPADEGPHLLIVDMGDNPYQLLGEPLLYDVARLTGEWFKAHPQRLLVITVPIMPPESSTFWIELRSLESADGPSRLLLVLANDGRCEVIHGQGPDPGRVFATEYKGLRARLAPERSPLSAKIVRRLGHYGVSRRRPGDFCRRYFFHVENAVPEISRLAGSWLERVIVPWAAAEDTKLFLLSRDDQMGLHEAIAGIAAARGCGFGRCDREGRIFDATGTRPLHADEIDGTVVPFFSVVDRTRTYEGIVDTLRGQDIRLAPRAWAVLITDSSSQLTLAKSSLPVYSEASRERSMKRREDCEQCAIGLPHTDPLRDRGHTLRSYDVWDIFLRSRWGSEKNTPPPFGHRFHYAPDLESVFAEHGNWLATKIMSLFEMLGVPPGVVIVCPDEPPIKTLVARLSDLMGDRPMVITIPGEVLDHRTDPEHDETQMVLDKAHGQLWQKQLSHLKGRGDPVVLLDEFRASGTTARTMVDVLDHWGIEPRAYVPVIDFSEEQDLDGLPVHSLYRIRAARSTR